MRIKSIFLLSCCIFGLVVTACKVTNGFDKREKDIKANQSRAKEIVQAIISYERDGGELPKSLDDLVPTYFAELPKTTSGQEFVYSLDDANYFFLSFDVRHEENLSCRYMSPLNGWDCSFGTKHQWLP